MLPTRLLTAARVTRLFTTISIALICAACAAGAAVAPPIASLAVCLVQVAAVSPALSFLDYLAAAETQCGADLEAILAAIMSSTNPSVISYQSEAKNVLSDPQNLAKLKAYFVAHPPSAKR